MKIDDAVTRLPEDHIAFNYLSSQSELILLMQLCEDPSFLFVLSHNVIMFSAVFNNSNFFWKTWSDDETSIKSLKIGMIFNIKSLSTTKIVSSVICFVAMRNW